MADSTLGFAQSPGEGNLCEIVFKHRADVIVVCLDDDLFGLDNFDRVGDARGEAVARLERSVVSEIDIARGHGNLIASDAQIDEGLADIAVYLSAKIRQFRLTLVDGSLRLFDIAANAPALIKRNGQVTGNGECSVRIGVGPQSRRSVVGGRVLGRQALGVGGVQSCLGGTHTGLRVAEVGTLAVCLLQGLREREIGERSIGEIVGNAKDFAQRQTNHTGQR